MVLLAVLIILAAAVTAADVFVQNTGHVHAVIFGQDVGRWTVGSVFVAGAVLGVIFLLAVWLALRAAAWRRRRRRAEAARLEETRAQHEALMARNARLEQELSTGTEADERSAAHPHLTGGSGAWQADESDRPTGGPGAGTGGYGAPGSGAV